MPHGGATPRRPKKKRGGSSKGLSQADWRNWWGLNAAHYLDLEGRFIAHRMKQERDSDIFLGEDSASDKGLRYADRHIVTTVALPRVRELLNHESHQVRSEACLALGRSGVPTDQALLMPLVRDKHRAVRRNALYALGLLGNTGSVAPLAFVLKDSSAQSEEQMAAALALGLLGSEKSAEALQAAVGRTPHVRDVQAAALHALGFIDSVKARVFLKHYYYRFGVDPNLRAIALASLAMQGERDSASILVSALSHREVMVRRSAALAMGSLDFVGNWQSELARHRKELESVVSVSTGQPLVGEQVRNLLIAAEATAHRVRDRLDDDRLLVSDALVRVGLKDSDETVRNFSAIALGQVGDANGLKVLVQMFESSPSRSFQAHAALALGVATKGKGGAALLQALEHRTLDQVTRAAVILASGLKHHEAATKRIAREFKTRADAPTARTAAIALGLLGYRGEISRLRRAVLATSRPELKPSYGVALSLLGDAKSVDGLGKLVGSTRSSQARIQGARALGAMRDESSLNFLVAATQKRGLNDSVLAASLRAIGLVSERGRRPITVDYYRHLNHTLRVGRLTEFATL